uniref:Transmembrane protein 238 n=1 Tax=Chrysemys picta bellii TaxID=8478 RepID=A0A8C3I6L1_CHRPI
PPEHNTPCPTETLPPAPPAQPARAAPSPLAMVAPGGLGRCVAAFWLALAFDALGLVVLLTGVFANLFFSDLLIYAGGIGIFLSLIWWVFWYAGNLEVPPAELRDDVGLGPPKGRGDSLLRGLVRGLSTRISTGTAPPGRRRVGAGASAPARGTPLFSSERGEGLQPSWRALR